jgi:hypothetical protein
MKFNCIVVSVSVLFVAAALFGGQGSSDEQPLDIGTRKQLLVDDYVVDTKSNITRELGQATKANDGKPLVVADKPWENPDLFRIGSVIHDGGKFRMWYQMSDSGFGYAESEDGLLWTKPNQGASQNNAVDYRGLACLPDPHEADPAHKYKAGYGHETVKACLAHSPDGFQWTSYNNGNPVTGRAADTLNLILWDDYAKVYRLYTRTDYGRGLYGGTLDENRGTRDMINPDVKSNPTNWKTVREWKFDREGPWEYKRRQIYSLGGWIYEGIQFGLLMCYEWPGDLREGGYDTYTRHEHDVFNFYILTTRGNAMWDTSWVYAGKPLIPRGPSGSFDKDWVASSPNIITWNDKHWIYYMGGKERHDIYRIRTPDQTRWQCSFGLATLRLDGFVCLEARDEPGTVVTKPFKLEGDKLEVNVDAKNGELRVEVLDANGKPIPGFSGGASKVYEAVDELRLQPSWNDGANLSTLKGKVVRLKFHLKNARLYAFQVKA